MSNLALDFAFGRISGSAAGLTRGPVSPLALHIAPAMCRAISPGYREGEKGGRMQWVAVCLLS